jgi:MFS family permease
MLTDVGDPVTEQVVERETAATPRNLPRALTPFRTSAYRRLAVALVLSTFAGGVWMVALVWEVIRIGGGPAQLSIVSTAAAVGVVVPALLAGVVADRIPQKKILIGVSVVEGLGMATVATLSITGTTRVWHLAVVAAAIGMAMAFYYSAYSAWLPALVPEQDLLAVNGFEGMVRPTVGQALGPALAGFVVGAVSSGAALAVAAVFAGLSLLALLTVPLTPVRRDPDAVVHDAAAGDTTPVGAVTSAFRDMREGFVYMVRTPWLLATLLFASLMILVMMGPLEVLVPFLIKDRLGGGPGDHALVLAAFGIGGAVGSMVMASMRMPRRYLTTMNLLWGFGALPFVLFGIATAIWQVVGAAFVLGALFSAPMVIWGTLLQRRVPPHLLGRVASLDFFVSVSLMPVSMALAGPVSDAIGLRNTFLIAGIAPGVFAVAATLLAKLPADELAHPLREA